MKKLSLRGLADYMTASAAKQRTILRQYKYPAEDEAHAKILYYREARDRIAASHRAAHESPWLIDQADQLSILASSSSGRTKTRLKHNARAMRSYAKHFRGRRFELLKDLKLRLQIGDVAISAYPDLHVIEKEQEKLIKLDFGVDEPTNELIKIVSQVFLEAANDNGMGLPNAGVLYLDVTRGSQHRGARIGSRMRKNVEASCRNISAIWDGI